jgi:signal transduction histidine kinase/CheY-like chemotaxis protein
MIPPAGFALRGGVSFKVALTLVVAVSTALLVSGLSEIYFSSSALRAQLGALQRTEADAAGSRIALFVDEIVRDAATITNLPGDQAAADLRVEAQLLLRRNPAISHVSLVDEVGREQLFVSRFELDRVAGEAPGQAPAPVAHDGGAAFGPVYFRQETEPYFTIALPRREGRAGVALFDVNLKSVWKVIRQIQVGQTGYAYIVDRTGALVAHRNVSLVLRQENLSQRPQVARALAALVTDGGDRAKVEGGPLTGTGEAGMPVLAAFAPVPHLDWIVFVEQPLVEADQPVEAAIRRISTLLVAGLVIALGVSLVLARRIMAPVRALRAGAERFAAGELDHRIDVRSRDELQEVARQLNDMAAALSDARNTLEHKVEERTRELELANRAKTRFLAAAGHDLRQPVHALGLLISSLRLTLGREDQRRLADQADRATDSIRELLDNLLDVSRIEAGISHPSLQVFPVDRLLEQVEFTYAPEAAAGGIDLRVVRSGCHVRSDSAMLARILLNLAANAVRNTQHGRVLVGARRAGALLRIEVWDTGVGIPAQHIETIFQEFFKLQGAPNSGGLGLGLYIVKGLADQLGHPISVASRPGKGSVFRISVPLAEPSPAAAPVADSLGRPLGGRTVLVVDDDPAVLEAMKGHLGLWGCAVVAAPSATEAATVLGPDGPKIDLVLCDYRLGRDSGLDIVNRAAARSIPCILITGDTDPRVQREAEAAGISVLFKPVQAGKLRSAIAALLSREGATRG